MKDNTKKKVKTKNHFFWGGIILMCVVILSSSGIWIVSQITHSRSIETENTNNIRKSRKEADANNLALQLASGFNKMIDKRFNNEKEPSDRIDYDLNVTMDEQRFIDQMKKSADIFVNDIEEYKKIPIDEVILGKWKRVDGGNGEIFEFRSTGVVRMSNKNLNINSLRAKYEVRPPNFLRIDFTLAPVGFNIKADEKNIILIFIEDGIAMVFERI